jgi:hypothetical protein
MYVARDDSRITCIKYQQCVVGCTPSRCNCSGLASNAFDMDKHDPKNFKVTARLYLCNQADSAPNHVNRHLENEDFLTGNLT